MESAADGITSRYTNGISQSSVRGVPLMSPCIISSINAHRVRTFQHLSVPKD